MARPKSILPRLKVDQAKKSHNCQHGKTHRITKGENRLKVSIDRADEHYCVPCALEIIRRDIATLQSLAQDLES